MMTNHSPVCIEDGDKLEDLIIGESGSVTGVDSDADVLVVAARRAADAGLARRLHVKCDISATFQRHRASRDPLTENQEPAVQRDKPPANPRT
jgi:hypothetical protein